MISEAVLEEMIDHIVSGIYIDYPDLLTKYGDQGKERCREDNGHHFRTLEVAYKMENEKIFLDYAVWLNRLLTSRGMSSEHIIDNFDRILAVIKGKELDGRESFFNRCLLTAINELRKGEETI